VKCPECNTDGAYIGLRFIHCLNQLCKFYDARYAEDVGEESKRRPSPTERLILIRKLMELDDD
jgi:hypothetical protein